MLALVVGTAAQWSQECGGSWRHNSVRYNRTLGVNIFRHFSFPIPCEQNRPRIVHPMQVMRKPVAIL